MLVDFFLGTGIPKDKVFCSSLPGNDINEKISVEVKNALKKSVVNIAILSKDYYQSAYCLNEAGVLWYEDTPVIPIALPEINSNNMYGFLNSEYKLRRLNTETDVSYIYDTVREALSTQYVKASIITYESQKLRERYNDYLQTRNNSFISHIASPQIDISEITTDDERIVLYYILTKEVRKVSKEAVVEWLHENEIYDVNVDNAFDLLSSFDNGTVINGELNIGLNMFRKYSTNADTILTELKQYVGQHTKIAADTFKALWEENKIDPVTELFVAYIVDVRMRSFGDRWMAEGEIISIKQWEDINHLVSILSDNYGSCLQFFIQNDLVYESAWTSYGNPKEYTLCHSLQEFLYNCPVDIAERLQGIKDHYCTDFPF